jgi:hypothetical protein
LITVKYFVNRNEEYTAKTGMDISTLCREYMVVKTMPVRIRRYPGSLYLFDIMKAGNYSEAQFGDN